MTFFGTIFESPCGPLSLIVNEARAVVQIEFERGRSAERFRRLLAERTDALREDAERTRDLARQLGEYFVRARRAFDLELAPRGTSFQLEVWRELSTIPYGVTRTYTEVATAIGHPDAVRAVGTANGANPIPIVVPCHRVIGADGSLTGYGGGLENKRLLLELEGWRDEKAQLTLGFR